MPIRSMAGYGILLLSSLWLHSVCELTVSCSGRANLRRAFNWIRNSERERLPGATPPSYNIGLVNFTVQELG